MTSQIPGHGDKSTVAVLSVDCCLQWRAELAYISCLFMAVYAFLLTKNSIQLCRLDLDSNVKLDPRLAVNTKNKLPVRFNTMFVHVSLSIRNAVVSLCGITPYVFRFISLLWHDIFFTYR